MNEGRWKMVEKTLLENMGDHAESFELGPDSRLVEDLKLGSLRTVELVIQLEDELDISISDDELVSLVTVRDLVDLIDRKTVEA